jgi:hypothetical protein
VDYPLQGDSPVNDRAIQADATQGQGGITSQHQGQTTGQGRLLDLDDNRHDPQSLQACRQRKSGNTSSYDQNARLARHNWTLARAPLGGNADPAGLRQLA